MKIEELREIINTNPMKMVETAVTHFDALLGVAEAAKRAVNMYRSDKAKGVPDPMIAAVRVYDMQKALKKLEAVDET